MNNLDAFIDNLQAEIFDDAKQALGERGFLRWRNPKYNSLISQYLMQIRRTLKKTLLKNRSWH
jgi:hypothetical protein